MKLVAVWTEKFDSHLSTDKGLETIRREGDIWINCYPFRPESEIWGNFLSRFKLNDIPKYPKVRRDFALLLDDNVNFSQIDDIAQKTERKLLKDVSLFDVYEGKNLPNGKKSYAVSFILQDENKTLTDKQVDKIMGKLQHQFENQLGAELR